MIWTDRMDRDLRRLFDDGLSCIEIASVMGTTKNAIVGRCHRLGLYRSHRALSSFKRPLAPGGYTAPLGQPAPLLRLDPDGCKWPVSPHSATSHCFCNKRKMPDRPYCREHWRKAVGL